MSIATFLPAPARTTDPYDPAATAETFDLDGWFDAVPWEGILPQQSDSPAQAAARGALRVEMTRIDPLLFAYLMFPHHIRDAEGRTSFADAHLEWLRLALDWATPATRPQQHRHAVLAPRDTGKSTWWLLLLPMWAACHGHVRFAAAFADSAPQAELHLRTFRSELQRNLALRRDFPDMCSWGKRPAASVESDTKSMLITRSGFVYAAKGIDSSSLGMKVGERRPDLLLLDDVEPDESSYSDYQMGKRLTTIKDAVLPLNIRARVLLSGTVTMPGSVTHQLARHAKGELDEDDKSAQWISDESFRVHHHLPIITRDDGTERSMWPQRWPLDYLASIRHTRSYRKNFLNDPFAADSDYWAEDDITHGRFPTARTYLSVDGAVTAKRTSDYTGLAVVSWAPPAPPKDVSRGMPARCLVEYAQAVRLKGKALRERVLQILDSFPEIGAILVEGNQGQDLWYELFDDMPVKVVVFSHDSESKESRAGRLLNLYQLVPPRVVHAERLPALEGQMIGFPKGPNDDLVDAVGNAVLRFLKPPKRKVASASSSTYA